MSVRGGLFDFCGRVGDLEKEHPAGTLVPKNIHAHYHCQKKTNSRMFSEPKKKACYTTKYHVYRPSEKKIQSMKG